MPPSAAPAALPARVSLPEKDMPLDHGYGVLIGTITGYKRDDPDMAGNYYHVHLTVAAPAGTYNCAIDVDSKASDVGVEWRTLELRAADVEALVALGNGWHMLPSTPASGALDYIRSPMFAARVGCALIFWKLLKKDKGVADTWKKGNSLQALADLEPLVTATRNAGLKVLVFGEPYHDGTLGVHNIHQNQGDPLASKWSAENGIWQDGCTIFQKDAETYVAFMNKFTSQSYNTDDLGHPA
jgi:hypothetical protein